MDWSTAHGAENAARRIAGNITQRSRGRNMVTTTYPAERPRDLRSGKGCWHWPGKGVQSRRSWTRLAFPAARSNESPPVCTQRGKPGRRQRQRWIGCPTTWSASRHSRLWPRGCAGTELPLGKDNSMNTPARTQTCHACGRRRPVFDVGLMCGDMSRAAGLPPHTVRVSVAHCRDNLVCRARAAEVLTRTRLVFLPVPLHPADTVSKGRF